MEQLCHVLYEILVQSEMDDFVLEVSEFVLSLEELPQFALKMAIFKGYVSEI